ncbi:MAG: Holliday junction resolvase RuvX [Thermoanaerobaculia bacterium]
MRLLAVDFGERRIGLAVSDESGLIVVPVGTVTRRSDEQAAAAVVEAARERGVERIVVGHPVRAGGVETLMARRARNFARRLAEVSGLRVDLHGEALTSRAADSALESAGVSAARRAAARDAEAAAAILRDYLAGRDGP